MTSSLQDNSSKNPILSFLHNLLCDLMHANPCLYTKKGKRWYKPSSSSVYLDHMLITGHFKLVPTELYGFHKKCLLGYRYSQMRIDWHKKKGISKIY
jgi:hypothetical protein